MAIDEHTRHHLHEFARETWDDQAADTLMEMLPPVGWADVATKRDLDALEERMDARFEMVDLRLASFEERTDARFAGFEDRTDTPRCTGSAMSSSAKCTPCSRAW